jgi:hypothetical protein
VTAYNIGCLVSKSNSSALWACIRHHAPLKRCCRLHPLLSLLLLLLLVVVLLLLRLLFGPGAYLAQTPTVDGFKLVVTSQFYVPAVDAKGFLTVALPELELAQQQELAFTASSLDANELNKVEVKSEFEVAAESVQLWWPAGGNYGPHKLYDVEIGFTPDGQTCATAAAAAPQQPAPEQQQQQRQQQQEPALEIQQPSSADNSQARVAAIETEYEEPMTPDEAVAALEFADVDQREAQQLLASKQLRHLLAQEALKQIFPADAAAAQPGTEQQQQQQQQQQPISVPQQLNKGEVVAAAAIKGILGAVANRFKEHQASAGAAAAQGPEGAISQQCSNLKKRIGFRTIELVMQPLPQAVQELFGDKRGFDFDTPKQKISAILGREGGGQWANNEEGVWSNFAGDDVEVCAVLCCAVRSHAVLRCAV